MFSASLRLSRIKTLRFEYRILPLLVSSTGTCSFGDMYSHFSPKMISIGTPCGSLLSEPLVREPIYTRRLIGPTKV